MAISTTIEATVVVIEIRSITGNQNCLLIMQAEQ